MLAHIMAAGFFRDFGRKLHVQPLHEDRNYSFVRVFSATSLHLSAVLIVPSRIENEIQPFYTVANM